MTKRRRFKYQAYHEAGHAVVADHYNLLRSVALKPKPVTRIKEGDDDLLCIIHYAGLLAQARYQRANRVAIHLTAAAADDDFIAEVIARRTYLPDDLKQELRRSWEKWARKILAGSWPAVRVVATALLAKGRLTAAEVRNLVRQEKPVFGAGPGSP